MGIYLQDIISDIIRPLADTVPGAVETISTEEALAKIDVLNSKIKPERRRLGLDWVSVVEKLCLPI